MKTSRKIRYFQPRNIDDFYYEYEWMPDQAPVVASNWFTSISEIEEYLEKTNVDKQSDFTEFFDLVKSNKTQRFSSTLFLQSWIYFHISNFSRSF